MIMIIEYFIHVEFRNGNSEQNTPLSYCAFSFFIK